MFPGGALVAMCFGRLHQSSELCIGAGANPVRPAKRVSGWRARAVGFQGHPQTDRQQLVSDRTKQANKRTHSL